MEGQRAAIKDGALTLPARRFTVARRRGTAFSWESKWALLRFFVSRHDPASRQGACHAIEGPVVSLASAPASSHLPRGFGGVTSRRHRAERAPDGSASHPSTKDGRGEHEHHHTRRRTPWSSSTTRRRAWGSLLPVPIHTVQTQLARCTPPPRPAKEQSAHTSAEG